MKKRQKRSYNILRKDKDLTPFQKRVYKAVSAIPKGEVRSYKWVAAKIGSPNSSRAVGTVLKRNPHVGIVPCHRVIKEDGSLGGFSKGRKRKLELLKSEGLDLKSGIKYNL